MWCYLSEINTDFVCGSLKQSIAALFKTEGFFPGGNRSPNAQGGVGLLP